MGGSGHCLAAAPACVCRLAALDDQQKSLAAAGWHSAAKLAAAAANWRREAGGHACTLGEFPHVFPGPARRSECFPDRCLVRRGEQERRIAPHESAEERGSCWHQHYTPPLPLAAPALRLSRPPSNFDQQPWRVWLPLAPWWHCWRWCWSPTRLVSRLGTSPQLRSMGQGQGGLQGASQG